MSETRAQMQNHLDLLRAQLKRRDEQIAELEEQHRMELAAISTACVQNTLETRKERIDRSNPYWTQAYEDVCMAVNREIAHRTKLEDVERAISIIINILRRPTI